MPVFFGSTALKCENGLGPPPNQSITQLSRYFFDEAQKRRPGFCAGRALSAALYALVGSSIALRVAHGLVKLRFSIAYQIANVRPHHANEAIPDGKEQLHHAQFRSVSAATGPFCRGSGGGFECGKNATCKHFAIRRVWFNLPAAGGINTSPARSES